MHSNLRPNGGFVSFIGFLIIVCALFHFLPRKLPVPFALATWAVVLCGPLVLAVYRSQLQKRQRELNESAHAHIGQTVEFALYLRPFITAGRLKVENNTERQSERYFYGKKWDLEFALSIILDPLPLVDPRRR